nr:hypothetical protein CFP56_64143 [Quercus suber]
MLAVDGGKMIAKSKHEHESVDLNTYSNRTDRLLIDPRQRDCRRLISMNRRIGPEAGRFLSKRGHLVVTASAHRCSVLEVSDGNEEDEWPKKVERYATGKVMAVVMERPGPVEAVLRSFSVVQMCSFENIWVERGLIVGSMVCREGRREVKDGLDEVVGVGL